MWLSVGLIAPLAFGFLGDVFWGFDLLANFRPHAGVVLAVAAAAWWWVDREVAGVMAFAALVGLASVLPAFVGSVPRPAGPSIEIVTFNVGVSNPQRGDVAAFLAAEDPDLVFLFESSFEWEDAMERADLPLTQISIVPRGQVAGVTVLASNRLDPAPLEIEVGGEAAAVAVTIGSTRVDVIGVHPPSPTTGARAESRDRMLAATGDWVASRANPVIVLGDFNATPWSASFRSLRWRGGLVDTLAGGGLQGTWPDGWGPLMIPIDHVLIGRGLGAEDRRTGPSFGSAHRPVLITVGPTG